MSLIADIRAARATLPSFLMMGALWSGFHSYAPAIKAVSGASDWGFGLGLFASSLGSLAAMGGAPWVERWAGRRAMSVAGAVMLASFLGLPWITGFFGFLVVMLAVGAGMGLMDILMNAQVARDEAATGRSLMNLNHGSYSLAYALAAVLAAGLRGAGLGIDIYYSVATVVGLMVLWRAGRAAVIDPVSGGGDDRFEPLPGVVIWIGLIVLIGFASENAVESWSALFVERTLGGSPVQGPLGPAALGMTMAVGRLSGQVLVRRVPERRLMQWGAGLAVAGVLMAASAVAPWMAYLGFAAAGLGISVQAPMALALIGRSVPAGMRTRAIARGAVVGYGGFFIGPPMIGAVAEVAGLRAAFVVVAIGLLIIPPLARRR